MNDSGRVTRGELLRESLVFQVKLLIDGFRDLVLVPISLLATVAGLFRGGDRPDREFRQVIDVGRMTEQWINLFGNHEPAPEGGRAASLDQLLEHAEEVVREQARKGAVSAGASEAIERAIEAAQRRARNSQSADDENVADAGTRKN